MAYQIAFDLYESATQHFMTRVTETLNTLLPKKSVSAPAAEGDETKTTKDNEAKKEESKSENEDAEK